MRTSTRYLVLAAGVIGLGTAAVGALTRAESLKLPRSGPSELGGARAAMHGEIERLESVVPAGRTDNDGLWRGYLEDFERQREDGHPDMAIRALHDAYGAALQSRRWQAMIAVGDAFMVVGRAPGNAAGARIDARQAYLTALIRARRARSVEGALRSAEAFERLGERDAVDQCLNIAGLLAEGNEIAQQRVREARQRWMAPFTEF